MNCSSLESITIPNGVTNIGEYAFYGCSSLTSVTIPNGVSKIADRTFSGCEKLYSITLPESITEIEGKAFQNCSSLTNVTIPNNVANIGSNAFEGCSSLTSIVIPEGVRDIEDRTFYGCESLTSVSIPTSVSNISEYAFYGCKSLTDIIIPDNMIWIRKEAFRGCSSLVSITIPEKVTVLDYSDNVFDSVFADCTRLLSINWNSNSPLSISKYFTSTSNTANRLFYINSDAEVIDDENEDIRPIIIRNGQIDEINLFDNQPLYIPEPFTAQHISYTHNFSKETQRGVASGWESLVLPFDVQSISCDSVEIVPFGANAVGYSKFWLAEVNPETGFTAATSIEANKPYILAMPNSTEYGSGNITGSVTFSATNVTVQPTSNEKTECAAFALTPCWSHINDTDSTYNEIYVLNDSTYTAPNQTVYPAGSVFVRSLRPVRPFEAYYTPANGAGVKEFFPISEMENGIRPTPNPSREGRGEASAVYDLSGRRRRRSLSPSPSPIREGRAGVYIKDGRKIMVK